MRPHQARFVARVAFALALVALVGAGTGCVDRLGSADANGGGAAGSAAGDAAAPAAPEADPAAAPAAVPRAVVDPVNPHNLRLGPTSPRLGVAYPFDLYSHCGIDFAHFGGRIWRAERAMAEPRTLPDANGEVAYTAYTAGTMTLLDDTTARFVIDERRYEVAGSAVVIFRPTTAKPARCR
jgi:hypothetical protein